jgi:hypothetical protein
MDSEAVRTVVVYWHVQAEPEKTPRSTVIAAKLRASAD